MKGQENSDGKKKINLINTRYIFYGFLSLLFGITLSRNMYKGELLYVLIAVLSLIFVLIALIWARKFKILVVIFAMFFLGNGLYFASYQSFYNKCYEGEHVVVGRLSQNLTQSGSYWSVVLDNVSIDGKSAKNINLEIVDYDGKFEGKAGNIVTFVGNISKVKLFNLGQFSLTYYRNKVPQESLVNADKIAVINYDENLRYDEKIKIKVHSLLLQYMNDDNAEIAYSVLFGDRSQVDRVLIDAYNTSGIAHILAVSGLHVGFLVAILYFFLKKCNKYVRFGIIASILLFYCVLCGFVPSVVRASIMALVMMIAKLSGRQYDNVTSLSFAGLIIVLFSPLTALDVGFLMSYFSVASIFLLQKPIYRVLSKIFPSKIASALSITIAAEFGILPFVASFFQSFNFTSLLVNLIAIPLLSVIFPILLIFSVLGIILNFFGNLLVVADWGIKIINFVAKFFASSNLQISLKPFPIIFSILLWLGAFSISKFLMIKPVLKCLVLAVIVFASCITMIIVDVGSLEKNKIEYSYYAGQTLYLVNEQGENMLITDGNFNKTKFAKYAHLRGIKHLDYFVTLNDFSQENNSCQGLANPSYFIFEHNYFVLNKDQAFDFGQYKIKYIYSGENVVGVSITFNNYKIFFASSDKMSYNEDVKLSILKDYDFKFLNSQTALFDFQDDKTFDIFSVKKFGNFKLTFKGAKYKLNCID